MLTPLQLELTKLIGKKELTFGCLVDFRDKDGVWNRDVITTVANKQFSTVWFTIGSEKSDIEIIGHPATLSDFHRWMNNHTEGFTQNDIDSDYEEIAPRNQDFTIKYDSSKEFLEQDESILKQIRDFISSINNS